MPDSNPLPVPSIRHYHWAGLDFMLDTAGQPVLIEANRSSHMLGEYLQFIRDERPFELTADVMNDADGPPCLLWRRADPLPDADEDACFIGEHLTRYLREPPVICNVEDNQEPRAELIARDGRRLRPGSIFRWWYGLPWDYERAGVTVINPNCVWHTVRDKQACYETIRQRSPAMEHLGFRVPVSFPVQSASEAQRLISDQRRLFAAGFVLKPRIGWGGAGVQIGQPGDIPREFMGRYLLSERIIPPKLAGRFWEVRVFVMAGQYLGGIRYTSRSPHTNYWQGGTAEPLDPATAALLEPAAVSAVQLLDQAADEIHRQPRPPADSNESDRTRVVYEGRG